MKYVTKYVQAPKLLNLRAPYFSCDMELKLKKLGLDKFVDTVRFYISMEGFMKNRPSKYKHVFMDEAEAICIAFKPTISQQTISALYDCYHKGNCSLKNCNDLLSHRETVDGGSEEWGQLWFLVDINQATLFLPRYSPSMLKTPSVVLSKVMRSTGCIFSLFRQFYSPPLPATSTIGIGHYIQGPPTYWVTPEKSIQFAVVRVIIDLCSTKGFKPHDLCVIPFLINENFTLENINNKIAELFVENGYRPNAVGNVEEYLTAKKTNDFLITWALRVKGLEFKVVIMVFDEDDFDVHDPEDRNKTYIIASRCTCLLILVCPTSVRTVIDVGNNTKAYPFTLPF